MMFNRHYLRSQWEGQQKQEQEEEEGEGAGESEDELSLTFSEVCFVVLTI